DVIGRLREGPVAGTPQDPARVTRAPKLRKEHGLIDWTRPAEGVCRQIRAMQPWPTAYTFWHRSGSDSPPVRLQLYRAVPVAADGALRMPGEVVDREDGTRLVVAAGANSRLEVLELQPAGKRRMTAAEFLRGHPVKPGDRFGPEKLT
ncbi:MAG TPA: methionyl-tRNA formyltransferase, partial [Gemmataceae bacterium]